MKAWVWTRTYKSNLLSGTREMIENYAQYLGLVIEFGREVIYCETDLILFLNQSK